MLPTLMDMANPKLPPAPKGPVDWVRTYAGVIDHLGHELRNYLMIIQNASALANRLLVSPERNLEKIRLFLRTAENGADKAAAYLDRISEFARLKRPPLLLPIDPYQIMGELAGDIEPACRNAGVRLDLDLIRNLPSIVGDRDRLNVALREITQNAFEAMPNGGVLAVSTSCQSAAVRLVIKDTGKGMSAADTQRVFDPLFTTKPQGLGLGLAYAYVTVTEQGGQIDVTSVLGQGTSVTIEAQFARDRWEKDELGRRET